MKTPMHPGEALVSVCSLLMLAGVLVAGHGWAQTAGPESSIVVDAGGLGYDGAQSEEGETPTGTGGNAPQEAAELRGLLKAPYLKALLETPEFKALLDGPDQGATGSQGPSRTERQQRRAAREARRNVNLERVRLPRENAAQTEAIPAPVSRVPALTGMADIGGMKAGLDSQPTSLPELPRQPAVSRPPALSGIEVSFKVDPRHTKGLYMGESWASPPISLHADGRSGTTSTVIARVQLFDTGGQPVDTRPDWIPADPEMVTVSPGQGNEVQITVRHAGQSSLKVTSQGISRQLSILAWYQEDTIQVEISERP
ncbi:MAG TPA: hypothetical protein VLT62_11505 [Candidatus Methylomirabilis sp.]|nr:hypothetical protein [Candidatus Methylomirabilis sp.]